MSTGTDIIQKALQLIGAHSIVSPASAESILTGKDALNSMLEMWLSKGIDFGYSPLDVPGDALGEPPDVRNGIISSLAMTLAPNFDNGKGIVSTELRNLANSQFFTIQRIYRSITIPNKVVSSTLPKGAGNDQGILDSAFYNKGSTITN